MSEKTPEPSAAGAGSGVRTQTQTQTQPAHVHFDSSDSKLITAYTPLQLKHFHQIIQQQLYLRTTKPQPEPTQTGQFDKKQHLDDVLRRLPPGKDPCEQLCEAFCAEWWISFEMALCRGAAQRSTKDNDQLLSKLGGWYLARESLVEDINLGVSLLAREMRMLYHCLRIDECIKQRIWARTQLAASVEAQHKAKAERKVPTLAYKPNLMRFYAKIITSRNHYIRESEELLRAFEIT
jgi:hypothetical protein